MRSIVAIYAILIVYLLSSCKEEDKHNSKELDPETIYMDYKIAGDEDREFVTCVFQFRQGGMEGKALRLQEPGSVALDGVALKADSTPFTGPYYEIQKPLSAFAGRHRVTFTDINGKEYIEEFNFVPFTLSDALPEKISKDSFRIKLLNAIAGTRIRYVLTDTAADTDDINESGKISASGMISINRTRLQQLRNGPVILMLTWEEDRKVKNGTREGGVLSISYGLRRDFELSE